MQLLKFPNQLENPSFVNKEVRCHLHVRTWHPSLSNFLFIGFTSGCCVRNPRGNFVILWDFCNSYNHWLPQSSSNHHSKQWRWSFHVLLPFHRVFFENSEKSEWGWWISELLPEQNKCRRSLATQCMFYPGFLGRMTSFRSATVPGNIKTLSPDCPVRSADGSISWIPRRHPSTKVIFFRLGEKILSFKCRYLLLIVFLISAAINTIGIRNPGMKTPVGSLKFLNGMLPDINPSPPTVTKQTETPVLSRVNMIATPTPESPGRTSTTENSPHLGHIYHDLVTNVSVFQDRMQNNEVPVCRNMSTFNMSYDSHQTSREWVRGTLWFTYHISMCH